MTYMVSDIYRTKYSIKGLSQSSVTARFSLVISICQISITHQMKEWQKSNNTAQKLSIQIHTIRNEFTNVPRESSKKNSTDSCGYHKANFLASLYWRKWIWEAVSETDQKEWQMNGWRCPHFTGNRQAEFMLQVLQSQIHLFFGHTWPRSSFTDHGLIVHLHSSIFKICNSRGKNRRGSLSNKAVSMTELGLQLKWLVSHVASGFLHILEYLFNRTLAVMKRQNSICCKEHNHFQKWVTT